jgi:hypothetical protein
MVGIQIKSVGNCISSPRGCPAIFALLTFPDFLLYFFRVFGADFVA